MSPREFESLVAAALQEIPERFRARLRNIAVVVDDAPTAEQLEACDVDSEEGMYGYYEGVPLLEREGDGEPLMPDRIIIFREPLLEDFGDDAEELRREVVATIRHEIAHHFGIDDDRLEELGKY